MAGQKNTDGRKVFQFMKSEESMAVEDSMLEECNPVVLVLILTLVSVGRCSAQPSLCR